MTTTDAVWLSATTCAEDVEVCYRWTIYNASLFFVTDMGEERSTPFNSSDDTKWSWYCLIEQKDGGLKFGLYASYLYSDKRIPTEYKFSLIGPKGEVTLAGPHYHIFHSNESQHHVDSLLTKTELLRYKTDPGDTLTIVCRVRAILSSEISDDTLSIPACKMQHDLETILKDQQFTDVTLVVEGHSIKAHKAILAARSPVFAAMFSMEENRQNTITITDIQLEAAQKLLQFIYTGETDIVSKTVDQLLVAADKYGLIRLKSQCEEMISDTLTVPTAIRTLIFADRMKTPQLKSHTVKFIKTNFDKLVESAEWKTMAVEHPTLQFELCLL